MQSTLSFQSLQGPLWAGVLGPDRILSMGENRTKLHTNAKLNWLRGDFFDI